MRKTNGIFRTKPKVIDDQLIDRFCCRPHIVEIVQHPFDVNHRNDILSDDIAVVRPMPKVLEVAVR